MGDKKSSLWRGNKMLPNRSCQAQLVLSVCVWWLWGCVYSLHHPPPPHTPFFGMEVPPHSLDSLALGRNLCSPPPNHLPAGLPFMQQKPRPLCICPSIHKPQARTHTHTHPVHTASHTASFLSPSLSHFTIKRLHPGPLDQKLYDPSWDCTARKPASQVLEIDSYRRDQWTI